MKCAYLLSLVLLQLIFLSLHGQFYFSSGNKTEPELLWEAGIAAGGMNCLTDIGGATGNGKKFIKDLNVNQTRYGASIFIAATWHYQFGIKLQGSLGRIAGSDAALKNSTGAARNRYQRNLQFSTGIQELVLQAEIYPLMLADYNRNLSTVSPFVVVGIGGFSYNPQALINHAWVDLRPLHTEGQGFAEYPQRKLYKRISWCLPVGAGIKYDAAGLINLRLELLYRFTGTDYLDDVSTKYIDPLLFKKYLSASQSQLAIQLSDRTVEIAGLAGNSTNAIRGNAGNRDAYFSCMLTAGIVLGRLGHK